jgi:hypothetical protein
MRLLSALLAFGMIAAAPTLGACSVKAFSVDTSQATVNPIADSGTAGEFAASPSPGDAAGDTDAGVQPAVQGSPLCHAVLDTCYPDTPVTAEECGAAADAGNLNPSGYPEMLACRVQAAGGSTAAADAAPSCAPAGTAGDGSWCKSSAECAPTYDCVGAGTCQRYCCSGNAQCLAYQFCDIQPTAAASTVRVPVCMPIHPIDGCLLLVPDSCPLTQTCAVVRENGATSCVSVGAAKAGDECETDHCGAGLVCLGTPGQRRCYQLCHTTNAAAADECSTTQQQCKGGLPLFPDPAVGICQ